MSTTRTPIKSITFDLPDELIATHPTEPRDFCKMLVYHRATQTIHHTRFHALPIFLTPKDMLIFNQTKVNPSRLFWTDPKNKKQELLLIKPIKSLKTSSTWEAIVSGKKLQVNHPYTIEDDLQFELVQERNSTLTQVKLNQPVAKIEKYIQKKGELALPPYILKRRLDTGEERYTNQDTKDYQTMFSKTAGSVAAPTAGLHFTKGTFAALKNKKIKHDFVDLSVGWGTFAPLTQKELDLKQLHPESCKLSSKVAGNILSAKQNKQKILAVGSTAVRTLETWAQEGFPQKGINIDTSIFIFPPYEFKVVDSMLTNFHLPNSSLLMLVAAFLGKDGEKQTLKIYREAIENNYRFYSYGDCMLIL